MELTGVALAREYYEAVVRPLLDRRWPEMPHAAGRLGSGSEVLGFDDAMSRDHDWGLRLTLLVDRARVDQVDAYLQDVLPDDFHGWPTRFAITGDPVVRHRVEVNTAEGFCASRLGIAADVPWGVLDWLSLTGQCLLEVTGGAVFTDSAGTISAIRRQVAWYPDDVWRYVVAVDWARIGQELPLMGRAGVAGDELGARVLAGRLVQIALHLGFLLERRWAPYAKWLGTGFATLPRAGAVLPLLAEVLAAGEWRARHTAFCQALAQLSELQAEVGLPVVVPVTEPFFDRPFHGVNLAVVRPLLASIEDPEVRGLPAEVGSIEQWSNNVKLLTSAGLRIAAARGALFPGTLADLARRQSRPGSASVSDRSRRRRPGSRRSRPAGGTPSRRASRPPR